ncbi:UV excision repair protein rad23 [Tritrichomonas musculus]|uniref:UV excision repair protein rad23 n=1 Tax=Tritrichomonas musculus TaxID=1915356 RepID=A0ABR2KZR7_9EUKA
MIFHLLSGDGQRSDIVVDGNGTLSSLIEVLKQKKEFDLNNIQFYQNKKLVSPKSNLAKNDDGSTTLIYFDTYKYPPYSFPTAEFEYSFDLPIFSNKDINILYPDDTNSSKDKKPHNQSNLTSIRRFFPTMRFEYTEPCATKPSFPLTERVLINGKYETVNSHEDENEDDSQSIGDPNVLSISEMTRSLTPDEQDTIHRLCQLGYDQDFITEIYFHVGRNEELVSSFLSQIFH